MLDDLPVVQPDPANRHEPFPLTDTQQAYLLGRGPTFELGNNSVHGYYEYEGALDVARFDAAWRRVIARHDMLRAVVLPDSGQQQVLHEVPPFEAEIVDLRGLDPAAVQAALEAVRERLSHEVRPPERWPLFTVVVSRLTDARARVHVGFDGLNLDYLSWRLLLADLTRFYADPNLELPPPALTFRDYVLAEAAVRDTDLYRQSEKYWLDRLHDLPPAPQLPMVVDPAAISKPRFIRRDAWLDRDAWTDLKTRAAQARLTPTGAVLAVFAEVLATWSESAHFTLNLPRLQRLPLHPEVDEILGAFTSLTLLEVDNRARDTFGERAHRLQRQLWEDLTHSYVSGMHILRELVRSRSAFGRAMMPVVLTSTLSFSAGADPLLGRQLEPVYLVSQTPQVFMDVQIEEEDGALYYSWDTVDELFPAGMTDDMFAAFRSLLDRLARDETAWSVTDFALLTDGHHARGGIAGPERPLRAARVQDLFVDQVTGRPGQAAVVTGTRTLTYAELYQEATRVGHWLRERGAAPDQPVAVVMEKGWEQVVGVYGALFAGAPYLPIDAAAPAARIRGFLDRCQAELVLTQSHLCDRLDLPTGARVLCLDRPLPAELSDEPLPAVTGPDDLAYVSFTSGSTGRPKGVMIEHHSIVNCVEATLDEYAVGPDDRCLAVTALHHDLSAFDLFGTLGAGGTLVVPDAGKALEPAHWAELIAAHGVTLWNSVPAMMEMLLDHVAQDRADRLASLRLVILGGDWIPLHVPRTLPGLVDGVRTVSIGGPTETTVWNIWYPITRVDSAWASVPYGRPIANTRYHVLDERMADRPNWVTGELYCAGHCVARGYWDDPERTAEAFVTHPVTGERLYCTGDLGRVLPDGTIEFAGRADFQLKIRGHRIEPGEIEAAFARHPRVKRALVTAITRQDGPGHQGLVAYVAAGGEDDGETPAVTPEELGDHLRRELPEHMVPGTIMIVDGFPLTRNGKIDRAALPSPDLAEDRPYTAPCTALEEVIALVWAQVLGAERVGVHDGFFALGGDSLRGTRIIALLSEGLDVADLSLKSLFSAPSVAAMAETMTAQEPVPGRLEQAAALYLEIERLSAEEVEAGLLAAEAAGDPAHRDEPRSPR